MNEFERYVFDLQGYIVVEGAFDQSEVAELNGLLDEYDLWNADHEDPRYREKWQYGDDYKIVGPAHLWDDAFRRAIVHPRLQPYLAAMIGPGYRYDHGHVLLMRPGGGKLRLHGGGTPYKPDHSYTVRDGQIFNGLVACSLALVDMSAEEGGFICLPGSHKSNFQCPDTFITLETTGRWVQRANVKAGDVVIFTEALTHGTHPWTGARERRTYLMKYAPGQLASELPYPEPADVPEAEWDDAMRGVFRRPFASAHDPETHRDVRREPVVTGA